MSADSWMEFLTGRWSELWLRTGEHLMLVGVSIAMAVLIGVPLGVLAHRVSWARGPIMSIVGVFQTIPSLAMLAFLLALIQQIGATPAIVALTLYALLPIVRNTFTGLKEVPPELIEAARGLGMKPRQQLRMVRIPLALPIILAGVRTAAVIGVGIATLSAFIGAGGLGEFIVRGLSMADSRLIFLGAVPAAVLALIVDYSIAAAEWALRPGRKSGARSGKRAPIMILGFVPSLVLVVAGVGLYGWKMVRAREGIVRIGTKNFTEQFILAELMAQRIEATCDLSVDLRFLGGTMICHEALARGQIDLYAEYTGTALTALLNRSVIRDPDKAFLVVAKEYRERFDVQWLEPFGFNNTYALTVRGVDARRYGWETVSDLADRAPRLQAGFTSEFMERRDGYPAIRKTYGLNFAEVRDLDAGLMYRAIARKQVDVISAFATDGRIAAFDLKPLRDDRGAFPPYHAAPTVRHELLAAHPEIRDALAPLAGLLDDATMRRLNYAVDGDKERPATVARRFLQSHDLLKGPKVTYVWN